MGKIVALRNRCSALRDRLNALRVSGRPISDLDLLERLIEEATSGVREADKKLRYVELRLVALE